MIQTLYNQVFTTVLTGSNAVVSMTSNTAAVWIWRFIGSFVALALMIHMLKRAAKSIKEAQPGQKIVSILDEIFWLIIILAVAGVIWNFSLGDLIGMLVNAGLFIWMNIIKPAINGVGIPL